MKVERGYFNDIDTELINFSDDLREKVYIFLRKVKEDRKAYEFDQEYQKINEILIETHEQAI